MRQLILVIALAAAACSPPAATTTTAPAPTPTPTDTMAGMPMSTTAVEAPITASGEVVSINLDAHTITIRHGAIEAIHWPAMMMAFQAEPSTLLYGIAVGDHVNFRLKSATETGVIVALDKQ